MKFFKSLFFILGLLLILATQKTYAGYGSSGGSASSIAWGAITGIPAGFADNTDDTGAGGGTTTLPLPSGSTTYTDWAALSSTYAALVSTGVALSRLQTNVGLSTTSLWSTVGSTYAALASTSAAMSNYQRSVALSTANHVTNPMTSSLNGVGFSIRISSVFIDGAGQTVVGSTDAAGVWLTPTGSTFSITASSALMIIGDGQMTVLWTATGSFSINGREVVVASSRAYYLTHPFFVTVATAMAVTASSGSLGQAEYVHNESSITIACYQLWVDQDFHPGIVPMLWASDRSTSTDAGARTYVVGLSTLTFGVSDPEGVCRGLPQITAQYSISTSNTGKAIGVNTNILLPGFNTPLAGGRRVLLSITRLGGTDASVINSWTDQNILFLGTKK